MYAPVNGSVSHFHESPSPPFPRSSSLSLSLPLTHSHTISLSVSLCLCLSVYVSLCVPPCVNFFQYRPYVILPFCSFSRFKLQTAELKFLCQLTRYYSTKKHRNVSCSSDMNPHDSRCMQHN